MSEATHIDLDSVSLIGQGVPVGDYVVQLIDVEAGASSTGKAMLKTTWDIVEGPYKGFTIVKRYFLSTFVDKRTGKEDSMGVKEIKTDANNLGVVSKLPKLFPLNADEARKVYAKAFNGVKAKMIIMDDFDKAGELKQYKKQVLKQHTTHAPTPSSGPSYA